MSEVTRMLARDRLMQIQSGVAMLKQEFEKTSPYRGAVTPATDSYESLDEMVDLIRAKLAHSESLELWAVDGEDRTICITGNNEQGKDHAEWITTLWLNTTFIFQALDDLLNEAWRARALGKEQEE